MSDRLEPVAEAGVPETQPAGGANLPLLRKLTREEARAEQRLFWSRMSVTERLAASAELTRRMYLMRGIDRDDERQIGLFAAFLEAGVEFAVVGGVAVNVHGYLRATNDLDVFIRPTEENAQLAFGALAAMGAPVEGVEPNDLLDDEANLRFGPGEDHIDILPSIGEMTFDQVWRSRLEIVVAGLRVPVISKADLIANKR